MTRKLIIFGVVIQATLMILFQISPGAEAGSFDHGYKVYTELLQQNVIDARVNYRGFIESSHEFDAFLKSLGSVREEELEGWTKEERLAFWINAYNAFTIKAVTDNYPITRSYFCVKCYFVPSNSIIQIKGVWDDLEFRAAGSNVTLGEIEHEILRKEFNEPRIHAAIVCASVGCPDLRNEAYTADRIYEQLGEASAGYINNSLKGLFIDRVEGKVKFSKIFKWFGEDFIPGYEDDDNFKDRSAKQNAVLNFAIDYLSSAGDREYILGNNFDIGYLKYDWHLNETEGQ